MDSLALAQLAHSLVALLYTFPQQLGFSWVSHLALIAGGIRAHRIKILHVRFPHLCKYVLLLLNLQLTRQLQNDVIQQLVVCQRSGWGDYHIAEHLIVNVAVQLLHQIWTTKSGVHFQEHQCHLSLWCEIRFPSTLCPHTLACQSEVLCHLTQWKQLLYTSQLALLEC